MIKLLNGMIFSKAIQRFLMNSCLYTNCGSDSLSVYAAAP